MKQFHRCTQYCLRIFLLLASPLLSSFFPDMPHAAPTTPAQGFIMDMTPLLGSNGRIKAIAPGCRAVTGFLEGGPFVWSRDFGLVRLTPPPKYFGMGDFLSDDGRAMLGFVSINDAMYPPPYGETWARPGFIWRYGERSMQYMSKHEVMDVEWYGLSADGKIALGYGKRKPPSAPPSAKDKAAENLELTPYYNRWFCIRNKRLRVLDNVARPVASPYYRLLSRDGKKLLQKRHDNSVQIVDLMTGAQRPLTFGGVLPHAYADRSKKGKNILRAGDPQNPLFRWGRRPGFNRSRLLTDAELKDVARNSPMFADWLLDDFFCSIPSFDGRFILCALYLKQVPRKSARAFLLDSKTLTVLARLDAKGNDIPIDDGPALMGMDISDDGKTILYEREAEIWIWNEDFVLPHDSLPRPMPLARYLEHFGLYLPPERSIKSAVMSPDGQCFFGELALYDDEQFPYKQFLACTDGNASRPHWKLNSKKILHRGDQPVR